MKTTKAMTHEEILQIAIAKAETNGWDSSIIAVNRDNKNAYSYWLQLAVSSQGLYRAVIFDQGFARSFWGEEETPINWKSGNSRTWQVHLQQMVLKPDPIRYLERFI